MDTNCRRIIILIKYLTLYTTTHLLFRVYLKTGERVSRSIYIYHRNGWSRKETYFVPKELFFSQFSKIYTIFKIKKRIILYCWDLGLRKGYIARFFQKKKLFGLHISSFPQVLRISIHISNLWLKILSTKKGIRIVQVWHTKILKGKKVKVKAVCWYYSTAALRPIVFLPEWVPSFISRGAAHTKRRERPLLAKEGTISGI